MFNVVVICDIRLVVHVSGGALLLAVVLVAGNKEACSDDGDDEESLSRYVEKGIMRCEKSLAYDAG